MNEKWMRDTGLVFGLVCLVLGYSGRGGFLVASGIFVALSLLAPKALYPIAWPWSKLVFVLNLLIPKVFFGLVFFIIVLPVGLARKAMKGDVLLLKGWKHAKTAFHERRVKFEKSHLEIPY